MKYIKTYEDVGQQDLLDLNSEFKIYDYVIAITKKGVISAAVLIEFMRNNVGRLVGYSKRYDSYRVMYENTYDSGVWKYLDADSWWFNKDEIIYSNSNKQKCIEQLDLLNYTTKFNL
jgi:hypothetical protein